MKTVKKLISTGAAAVALGLVAAPAMAAVPGVEAHVGVSNAYLFRGIDRDSGNAHVYGDLTYRHAESGLYASVWAGSSSADGNGGEINLIAGWSGDFNGFGLDLGLVNYYLPGQSNADTFGKVSEAYVGASYAGVEFYYHHNVAGQTNVRDFTFDNGYRYYSLSYTYGAFTALVGHADGDEPSGQSFDNDYTHVDLTYAFNDNLSFTLSKVVDVDDELNPDRSSAVPGAFVDDDVLFVVKYSIPLM